MKFVLLYEQFILIIVITKQTVIWPSNFVLEFNFIIIFLEKGVQFRSRDSL